MLDFPTMLIQMVWLVLPILTFLVCLKAKERMPGRGSSLMVLGSGLHILTALVNTIIQYLLQVGGTDFVDVSTYYMVTSAGGMVAQIVFLVGLYQFVMAVGKPDKGKDLLDYLPD